MSFTKTGNATLNPLVVGISAAGTATIDGGTDVIRNYVTIGQQTGSDGLLTITGTGSSLTLKSADPVASIGLSGTGELDVLAGGLFNGCLVDLGAAAGGEGTFTISGTGSKAVLSNDNGTANPGYAGFLYVGHAGGGTGHLNVLAGGVLEIRNTSTENSPGITLGRDLGSVGTGLIDGAGTAVNITQTGGSNPSFGGAFLGVGGRGQGTLTVSHDAQINLTGEYGMLRVGRGNNVGEPAPARLPLSEARIYSGADVNLNATGGTYYGAWALVGYRANANGKLTLDGNGSSLTVHGDNTGILGSATARLAIGVEGQGELVLKNGADVILDGGDDMRPSFFVGQRAGSIGTASLTGAGTTLTINGASGDLTGGGYIGVGFEAGSHGELSVTSGARLINDLASTNSVMLVGSQAASGSAIAASGSVVVDGNGNIATLLDAGRLLLIGAEWDHIGTGVGNVIFTGAGTGSVSVFDSAILRADNVAVGSGGSLGGNALVAGSVTIDGGGTILGGAVPGKLTVSGNLILHDAAINVNVNSLTAGTGYDQLQVDGKAILGAAMERIDLTIDAGASFDFAAGNRLLLVHSNTSLATDLSDFVVNVVDEPYSLAFLVSKEGKDLYFEALNSGSGAAVLDFGAASTIGAVAELSYGGGSGTGGRFDSVIFRNATALSGTAASDTFSVFGSADGTLRGMGGNDKLTGDIGSDTFLGGAGNDVLKGDFGADTLNGGTGRDTASYAGAFQSVNINLGQGTASGGQAQGDVLISIENLIGGGMADVLTGSAGANTISGGGGDDTISGRGGTDTLAGNGGADRFSFGAISESAVGTGRDVITDFSQIQHDRINLAGIDASPTAVNNNAFAFTGNGGHDGFTLGVEGQLRYDVVNGNTIIQLETTGDQIADSEIMLRGVFTLTTADFIL